MFFIFLYFFTFLICDSKMKLFETFDWLIDYSYMDMPGGAIIKVATTKANSPTFGTSELYRVSVPHSMRL